YGLTVIGDSTALMTAPALMFETGSAGFIRNGILWGWRGVGVEIQGPESCALASSGDIDVSGFDLFGNLVDFSTDADCIDEVAFGTSPARTNEVVDPVLIDPLSSVYPDLRPTPGSVALAGLTPPDDGFFDRSLRFRGAVAGATIGHVDVPWYAGW